MHQLSTPAPVASERMATGATYTTAGCITQLTMTLPAERCDMKPLWPPKIASAASTGSEAPSQAGPITEAASYTGRVKPT